MQFIVLSLFPELFEPFWKHGMIRRAMELNRISAQTIQIRDFAEGKHRVVDDRPYGGGPGMVMKPDPLAGAIREAEKIAPRALKVLLSPQGRPFSQTVAEELARKDGLILVCGRYEGIDERICQNYIEDEISIGDYVLTGGELGAMVVIDAVSRFIPGFLGCEDSCGDDSFSDCLLEHPHFTRPFEFEGQKVPETLLTGNHAKIEHWRLRSSLIRTFLKRKDLLRKRPLTGTEISIMESWRDEIQDIIDFHQSGAGEF